MTAIAFGLSRQELAEHTSILGIINTNSPMQLDVPMSEAVVELASANQVCCITPFTLAGSMSPATLAGTLAQQTAEVLAAATLTQVVRPGAPVMYGAFASNVDMQSGAPALGTPEYTKMALASAQIARRLGIPFRSSNTTTSNARMRRRRSKARCRCGERCWLIRTSLTTRPAGSRAASPPLSKRLIIDAEMLQMIAETLKPIAVNDDELALDAIDEVPPGGHHFGTAHTLERYESAFYAPMLSSRQNFEVWQEQGSHRYRAAGQRHLETAADRLRATAIRPGDRRSPQCLRRASKD